jgi:hypothetical protein
MDVREALATWSLFVCVAGGCAAGTGSEASNAEAPEREEPLDITVDTLDVVHGAVRIMATMSDGAADVEVRLAGACDPREVGGGVSTLSTLVWTLGERDIADAIGCGLAVRVRVREGGRTVYKTADLPVAVDVGAGEDPDAGDAPGLESVGVTPEGVELVLTSGRFVVSRTDFARRVLHGDCFHLDGASFAPSLSVGGTAVEVDAPEIE